MRLSLSGGRSGERATGAGGERGPGGEGGFCGGTWPSMAAPARAKRNARATSDALSERLATWLATRSRPEWNEGDFGMPRGETARRGFASAAANIARAACPAWTIARGGRQRHPSGSRRRRDRCELRGRPDCRATPPDGMRAHHHTPPRPHPAHLSAVAHTPRARNLSVQPPPPRRAATGFTYPRRSFVRRRVAEINSPSAARAFINDLDAERSGTTWVRYTWDV
ncbi:unnamed protein product, partial [Iphiclides podalirius]